MEKTPEGGTGEREGGTSNNKITNIVAGFIAGVTSLLAINYTYGHQSTIVNELNEMPDKLMGNNTNDSLPEN